MSTRTHFRLVGSGDWHVGVLARYCYRWDRAGSLRLRPDQPEPRGEELTAWKPRTDVVVEGHVYAAGGSARSVVAFVDIDGQERQIRATGDRRVVDARGTWSAWSRAEPFERLPLVPARAYGGFDHLAHELQGDDFVDLLSALVGETAGISRFSYPRNAIGMGFYMECVGEANRGRPVPNLELPEDPVLPERLIRRSPVDWIDAPAPATWGWTEATDFPRLLLLGVPSPHATPARPVLEVTVGALSPEDLAGSRAQGLDMAGLPAGLVTEPRAYLGSAPGMATRRLRGGETVRLGCLEPEVSERLLRLPTSPPVLKVRPPGCPWFELEPQLDTVVVRPDERELALTYSGKLRVAGRYPPDELGQVETSASLPS